MKHARTLTASFSFLQLAYHYIFFVIRFYKQRSTVYTLVSFPVCWEHCHSNSVLTKADIWERLHPTMPGGRLRNAWCKMIIQVLWSRQQCSQIIPILTEHQTTRMHHNLWVYQVCYCPSLTSSLKFLCYLLAKANIQIYFKGLGKAYLIIISLWDMRYIFISIAILTSPLPPAGVCRWRSPSPGFAWCEEAARSRSWCAACPAWAERGPPPAGSGWPAAAPSQQNTFDPSHRGFPPELLSEEQKGTKQSNLYPELPWIFLIVVISVSS